MCFSSLASARSNLHMWAWGALYSRFLSSHAEIELARALLGPRAGLSLSVCRGVARQRPGSVPRVGVRALNVARALLASAGSRPVASRVQSRGKNEREQIDKNRVCKG